MPSFFKFSSSSKRNNPYANPHHPGHNAIPKTTSANTTTASTIPRSHSQPAIPPRPASPRGSSDFLAEARQLAGRDPVTGRVAQQERPAQNRTVTQPNQASGSRANEEMSAYLRRAAQTRQSTGNRYDLYAQECQAQKAEEERLKQARGGLEYYAPERHVSEYYSGPVDYGDGVQRPGLNYAQQARMRDVDVQLRLP